MNPVIARYKIPFLIALVIGLALIALGGITNPVDVVLALLGAISGMFIIDLEYPIHAYLVDPGAESSRHIKQYVQSKNIKGFIDYLNNNEYNFGEMSIRSLLFQGILLIFTFYTVVTRPWAFAVAAILSICANLIYVQLVELAQTKTLKRWFWIYNGEFPEKFFTAYIVGLILVFVFIFAFV